MGLLTTCATAPHIDNDLKGIVRLYENKYNIDISNYHNITFKDLNGDIIGVCYMFFNYIAIDKTYWKYSNFRERVLLVFHELGHCDQYLLHDTRLRKDGCPLSIMYPNSPSKKCLNKYFDEYISEWN
jgi:hypothetical protein